MIKNLPKKLYSTLIVLILSLCVHTTNAQQVVILNHTVPSAATSCTNSTIAVDGRINCNNFVHVGNTQSVVGNTILCNIEYSAGPICTPAFGFFSYTFDFPSLSSGNYNVEIRTYLNGVVQDLETDAFNVISCCAATASFTASMTNKCTVDTDTFMFTNTSTGSISQEWYINDVLTSTSTDFAPDLTAIGSYSIRLNVSDGSCTDSVTQTVSVHQTPSVDLGPDIVACVNTFETLDAGAGQSSYAWNFTGSNSQTVNITNTGSYNVVVTNPQGCTATDTIEAVFNPLPVVDLGADTAICENVGLTLDAGNHQSYLWSNAASTQTIEAGNGGQFTVEVTDTNACQNTDDITVTLIVSPTIDLGADSATICPGDSLVLDAGAQTSYLWNTGDNTQNISANSNQLYFVEVTNVNNCTASDSVYLDFFANPVVDLGTDQSICFGENASFDAGSFASYLWSDNSTMQTSVKTL